MLIADFRSLIAHDARPFATSTVRHYRGCVDIQFDPQSAISNQQSAIP
jgi:hypothetical protein